MPELNEIKILEDVEVICVLSNTELDTNGMPISDADNTFMLQKANSKNGFAIRIEEKQARVYRDSRNQLRKTPGDFCYYLIYNYDHHTMDIEKIVAASFFVIKFAPDVFDPNECVFVLENRETVKSFFSGVISSKVTSVTEGSESEEIQVPYGNLSLLFKMVEFSNEIQMRDFSPPQVNFEVLP